MGGLSPKHRQRFSMQALPERIILCIDVAEEAMEPAKFTANLEVIKQTIMNFVHVKLATCSQHSFALWSLTDTTIWLQDFSSDPNVLANSLANLFPQGVIPQCFLGSLFDTVAAHGRLPELGPEPPSTITRALLVYTRSDVVPEMSEASAASWHMLTRRPDFVFDALFVHARAATAPMSQQVFNWLTNISQQFVASPENEGLPRHQFFLEAVRTNERRFYEKFALLLAHSGQRVDQFDFSTTLDAPSE